MDKVIRLRISNELKERFDKVCNANHINASSLIRGFIEEYVNKYEEELTMWEFENYTVYNDTDVLRFEDNEGNTIGYVMNEGNDLIDDLNNGADPIADGWEDGVGNTININGWGGEE